MRTLVLAALATAAVVPAAEFPEAEISNGQVTAKFYLPDAERGYYRGTRFDWSGQISSLKANGHEYFGQWNDKYDPKLHDAIMGPVEEFGNSNGSTVLGWDEAAPGGTAVRIGIGAIRKPDDGKYQRFKTYDIVDSGKWSIGKKKNSIAFTHVLRDQNGYAYRYTKTVRLTPGKTQMVIEHVLRNTGKKPIQTWQYNHNFFVIDNQPTGPGNHVRFPFDLHATNRFQPDLAEVRGREIVYLKELQPGQSAAANFEGSNMPGAYNIEVEQRNAGAGARITSDLPIQKIVYWSIRSTFCPEAYVDLSVEPGRETKWTYTYDFYPVDRK